MSCASHPASDDLAQLGQPSQGFGLGVEARANRLYVGGVRSQAFGLGLRTRQLIGNRGREASIGVGREHPTTVVTVDPRCLLAQFGGLALGAVGLRARFTDPAVELVG